MSRYEEILATYDTIRQAPLNRASHAVGIPLIMTSVIVATSSVRLAGDGAWVYTILATASASAR